MGPDDIKKKRSFRKDFIMKKYVMILAMVFTMGAILTGCGDKKETAEEKQEAEVTDEAEAAAEETVVDAPSLDDLDLDKIVELGQYKGLQVEKSVIEVTDEAVTTEINNSLEQYPEDVGEEEVVMEGDTVDIDFVGKIDGEEFDGGSAQGQQLQIGSGSFITGFEDGLVGTKKGQTVDLDLTFPEDYSEELSGKAVVFTVTVNAITRPLEEPTDEWVAANTQYENVEKFKEGLRSELEASNDESAQDEVQWDAWQQVLDDSKVSEYPEVVLTYGKETYKTQAESQAVQFGMTLEELLAAQEMTQEDFDQEAEDYAQSVADQMLVSCAIAEKEGFKYSDEESKEILEEYITNTQMTEEEMFEQYGENNIKQNVLTRRVLNLIVDTAEITEVVATPEPEETQEAEAQD